MTRHDYRNHSDAQAQVDALDPALAGRFAEVLDLLIQQGFDGMAHAMQTLLNEAMKLERSIVLGARPYGRTPERCGCANGYKPETVHRGVNAIDLADFKDAGLRPNGTRHKFGVAYKDHPRSGYIGLPDHGADIWFKNIKIRPLGD